MIEIVLPSRSRENAELQLSEPTQPVSIGNPELVEDSADIRSPKDVLEVLKAKPDFQKLASCLQFLSQNDEGFDLKRPSPLAIPINFVLVNDIIPTYWHALSTDVRHRQIWRRLVKCLRSLGGLGTTLTRLRALSSNERDQKSKLTKNVQGNIANEDLKVALQLLECQLHGHTTIHDMWAEVKSSEQNAIRRTIIADDLVRLFTSGRLLSTAAEAVAWLDEHEPEIVEKSWVGNGRAYCAWLGHNILQLSRHLQRDDKDTQKFQERLLSRSFSLGYSDQIVEAIFSELVSGNPEFLSACQEILYSVNEYSQPTLLNGILQSLANRINTSTNPELFISGTSALLYELIGSNQKLRHRLMDWVTTFRSGNAGFDIAIFRAVVTFISTDIILIKEAHQALLIRFGDLWSIQHDPVLEQEKRTQVLLLLTGQLHHKDPAYLKQIKSSSSYLDAISNRLATSLPRLQFLGMVLGMAVSELVDPAENQLKFTSPELESDEGEWYRDLTKAQDTIGTIADLKVSRDTLRGASGTAPTVKQKKKPPSKSKTTEVKPRIIAIEEITDSESEDDLPVYAKPDSDPEDEDEDPTVINRNKPTAPVYIRDLLAGLRDEENYDRYKLAIQTAPSLIRRKIAFGTEVTDHVEALATQMVGLKDAYDIEKFQELRLQAMVAIVIAKPVQMGQWFSNTYFNGDYSMSQRAAILTTLTLSARELAGFKEEDADMTGAKDIPDFPSKRLPEKYEQIWQAGATPVQRLSGKLERQIIKPMALEAADKATGPNVLKVRTFSSRMEVEKRRKRAIPNELAKVVADGFFFPLTGRWSSVIRARGEGSVFTQPFLLNQFLRTLALILSASGTSTLSLPAMTTEFWNLLLPLRNAALKAQPVLEALLFCFLTILEVNRNNQRRIAEDHAQELMATKAWTEQIFENLRGGTQDEERIKTLAAGLLIKVKEVVDQYQRVLMGSLVGFDP